MRRFGRAAAAALTLALALIPIPSPAVELPPAGNVYGIQTNGPNAAVTLGDWYTSNVAGGGAGYHYIKFQVPCGWSAATPIFVDIFSPEMNRVAGALGTSEEPAGNYDSTQFELYGPGATVGPGFATPAPGTGIPGTRVTYQPGGVGVPEAWVRFATLGAPVACGSYVLRSEVLTFDPLNPGGTGDDQNGWRLRIGNDNDGDPTNAPPANYDNPDGVAGTNDEIIVGAVQTTFQHEVASTQCQTFYEYVNPGQASVTFNNFDMDGTTRLRYYAPGDPSYDPNANSGGTAGTLSGNGLWNNGGTLAARVGDTIASPTSGWWRIVNCVGQHNQFIQEGQLGVPQYYSQPQTPTLTITKTDGNANVSPGQTITYTITVRNTSAGATAGAANNVVVTDTLPAGVTYTSCAITTPAQGAWSCSQAAGVVTYTETSGWINAGSLARMTVTVNVNQGVSGSITNTSSVNYRDALGNPFPQVTGTDVDPIIPRANLSITKTDSADPVNPGQAFTYTLTARNLGPSNATNIVVSDNVPSQFTVTGVSSAAGTCGNVGNAVTCTRPTFLNGATWTITVNVTANANTPGGTYTNTATVSGTENDPTPGNNTANQNTTVRSWGDLALTKTDGVASVAAGTSTTYTITITNNGPTAEPAGVIVRDNIPAGTVGSETEADCAIAAGVFSCTTAAIIPSGGSRSYQLTLAIPSGYAPATVVNTATITTFPITDPVAGNNASTDTDNVTRSADLSIAKTDSADPVVPGQAFSYTLTVTNNGPSDASTLTVSDTVPAQFTVTSTSSVGGVCGNVGNVVTCTRATLVAGATWTSTVNVTVNLATPGGTYTNTATVSATTADPVPGNNSGSQNTTVGSTTDLSITKSDGVASVTAGNLTTYTITVTNNGPTAEPAGVVITDNIPAGTVGSESEANCAIGAGVFSCTTTAVIPVSGSVSYQLTLAVAPGYGPATLSNTATITVFPISDPNAGNDSATDTDNVARSADLSITKSDGVGSVTAGSSTSYTITVTNNGPSTEPAGVVISDTIPAGTVGSESEADCAIAAGVFACTTSGSIAPGASVSYVLTLAVAPGYVPATLANTATITGFPVADPAAGNNTATDTDSVTKSADLSITKNDGAANLVAGTSTNYTIIVTNNGPSTEPAGVVVSDTIPAGTVGSESEAACAIAAGVFTCTTTAALAPGGSVSYVLTVAVPADYAPASVVNTATITGFPIADANGGNDSATDTDTVSKAADLSMVKTDSADPVSPGQAFSYTLTVTNNGPSDATTLTVSDAVPAQFTVTGASSGAGACGNVGNVVTCTRAVLPATAVWVITVSATVNLATLPGTYTNTASVSSATADPVPGNDSGSQDTTVAALADLSVTKDDGVASVTAGTSTTYTITITNAGPSTEPPGVVISDPIPGGTVGSESEAACAIVAGVFTCTTPAPILSGGSVTYQLTLAVSAGYGAPTLSNTASITSAPALDPNPANDSGSDTDAVDRSADLSLTKSDGVANVVAGTSTTYMITITNSGPSAEPPGVVISDTLPAGTTGSESEADCTLVAAVFSCTSTVSIPPAGSISYQVTLAISPTYGLPAVANTASITSTPAADPNGANDASTDTDSVTLEGDLSVTKSDASATFIAGTSRVYTITVRNNGPSTEPAGVVITDPIPAGSTGSETEPDCVLGASFVCTTTAPLASGASVSYLLTLTLPANSALASLDNTATITTFPITDPNAANDSATDTDTVTTSADLTMVKTDSLDPIDPGMPLDYTLTVTNNGPSDAQALTVTDTVPAAFTITGVTSASGVCGFAGNLATCTLGTLAAGGTWVITVSVFLDPSTPGGLYTDTASVSSTTSDPVPANNSDSEGTVVLPAANASITKTDGVASITAGNSTVYTITVTNNGPSTEPAGLVVTDPIPAGTTGSEAEADCAIVANVLTCTTSAPLMPGNSVTYQLTVAAPPGFAPATLVNTATITSTPVAEIDPTDDSATDSDTVARVSDLAITKTDGVASVVAGTSTAYTITLSNAGPSTEPAGVVISDPIPAGTVGSTLEPDCAVAAGAFSCTTSTAIAPGGSVSYVLTLAVSPGYALAALTNTASVTSAPATDPNAANDSSSDTDSVTTSADLSIAKADNPDPVNAGSNVAYTLTVTNAGPSDAQGVSVVDTLPGTVAYVSATPTQGSCSQAAGVVTCPLGTVAALGTVTIVIVVTTTIDGTITNTAAVSSTTPDPVPANDSDSEDTTVSPQADLSITKTDGVASIDAGTSTVYTITLTNSGPTAEPAGVVIADTIPAGTTGTEAEPDCAIVGAVFSCTTTAPIPSGGTVVYQLTVAVPSSYMPLTLDNTATITTFPITDANAANDSATDSDAVGKAADLAVVKTDSADPVNPSQAFDYTIVVTNNGPTDATGLTVTDAVPAQFTVAGVSSASGVCGNVGNAVTCTLASLVATATWTITVNVTVGAAAPGGTYTNTATVAGAQPDPVPANNSGSQNTTVNSFADLSVTKTDGVGVVSPGTNAIYTITLTNNGPTAEPAGAVVSDAIPLGTTGSESEPDCVIALNVFTCTTSAPLPSGNSIAYTLTLTVPSNYGSATLDNTATITNFPVADTNPGNDSATDSDAVVASADLSITKDDGSLTVAAGTSTTYVITVTNNGPADEPAGVALADPIPAGTLGSTSDPSCVVAAGVFSCATVAPIPAGGSVSYQLTLAVPPGYAAPTLDNIATITGFPIADPNGANDSATDSDTLTTAADLSITKTDNPDPVTVGGALTYTLTVSNLGPADAAAVDVTDTLPASVTFGTATPTQGSCSQAAGVVDCPLGTITAGSTVTITIAVTANTVGTITNNASVTSATADPVPANNSDSENTTVGALAADLSIAKTDSVDPVAPNQAFTYTLTVTNIGPGDAANVTVADAVPAQFTVTGVSAAIGSCSNAGNAVSCSLPLLAVGGTWTITVQVTVGAATVPGTYTNTAAVTSATADPVPLNNSASQATTVADPAADLSITKTDSADPVDPGGSFDYTITVTNAGPADATGVTVADAVPAPFAVASVTPSSGSCALVANAVSCTLPTLAPNATWTIAVSVTVDPNAVGGTYSNTATVTSTSVDPTPVDETVTEATTVNAIADLTTTESVNDSKPSEGDTIAYTVRVTNAGPSDATGMVVADLLPKGLTFVSSDPSQGSYDETIGTWDVGTLAAGESATLTIRAKVDAGTGGTTIANVAMVQALDQIDPDQTNDADTQLIDVAPAGGNNNGGGGTSGTGGTSFTGADVGGKAATMLLLLVFGLSALVASRKRRSATQGRKE